MYVTKNDEIKRFCNIFNFTNDNYMKKRDQIQAIKSKWV